MTIMTHDTLHRLFKSSRGTALLELAVFGGLTLAALGLLIRIGMQANFDQEIRMGAFRRALAAAAADDHRGPQGDTQDAMSVSYYYMLDRQTPNPSDGFLSLNRARSHASAFVERGRWLTFGYEAPGDPEAGQRTHPRVLVRLNDQEQRFRDNDFPCDGNSDFLCEDPAPDFDPATESIVREQWTKNIQDPGSNQIFQSTAESSVTTTTTLNSKAIINLRTDEGAEISSDFSTTAATGWSH